MRSFTTSLDGDISDLSRYMEASVNVEPGSQEQESQRAAKRRKLGVDALSAPVWGHGGPGFITIARGDISICPCRSIKKRQHHDLEIMPKNVGEVPIRVAGFQQKATDGYIIRLSISGAAVALDLAGHLDSPDLQLLRLSISMWRKSNDKIPRGTHSLLVTSPTCDGSSRPHQHIDLIFRLLIPISSSFSTASRLPSTFFDVLNSYRNAKSSPWTPQDFYAHVSIPEPIPSPGHEELSSLESRLYPFQLRAVRWLQQRETIRAETASSAVVGFEYMSDLDGRPCYMHCALGIATDDLSTFATSNVGIRGGILAEEMGLGKTVELIALICAHKDQRSAEKGPCDSSGLGRTPATLIITPPTILQQWRDELKTWAPDLTVYTYLGMRLEGAKHQYKDLYENCMSHDVVLTTYSTTGREIHYAESVQKNLRHAKRYEKRLSALTQLNWWRVCLDEAQMVESGVSNAAKVASMIPAQNRWCISGTPARSAKDLFGLLVFLGYQPYCNLPASWDLLIREHRPLVHAIFQQMTIRHNKSVVRDEINLPAQNRIVITIPFTAIEGQHYESLFEEMAEDCGLDLDGNPIEEDWDPDRPQTVEKLRTWLVRLRQTCLHPEVGTRNRRALGRSRGPLRSVAEVLEVMIEQNESSVRNEERNLLLSQLRRGQRLEGEQDSEGALKIWLQTLSQAEVLVATSRKQLEEHLAAAEKERQQTTPHVDQTEQVLVKTGTFANRLRGAVELQHIATFFIGNAYYQLKTAQIDADEGSKRPTGTRSSESQAFSSPEQIGGNADEAPTLPVAKSESALKLEKLEETYYDMAKSVRQELLTEARRKAEASMSKLGSTSKELTRVPELEIIRHDGDNTIRTWELRTIALLNTMNKQIEKLGEWRCKAIELLSMSLVDADETEVHGDEYELSMRQQEEGYAYVDAFRAIVSDRFYCLTGQQDLVDHEMRLLRIEATNGRGYAPGLCLLLLEERELLRPGKTIGHVRAALTGLRVLRGQRQAANASSSTIGVLNHLIEHLHHVSMEQGKFSTALDRECDLFRTTMNARLEYYRQLQAISDAVAPLQDQYNAEDGQSQLDRQTKSESLLRVKIAGLTSKGRYLEYLRDDAADATRVRQCIICTCAFEDGIITSCGHAFCKDCIRIWWKQHRSCPNCKKYLTRDDFHQVTYRAQHLKMEAEEVAGLTTAGVAIEAEGKSEVIYTTVRQSLLDQIQAIELDGSYGTKIDTMARHVLWLRKHDPGAKVIVFSQFRDFLNVLARAFGQFQIGFSSIDREGGISRFKEEAACEVFFLHAKAQASGLNLVNARHVFLAEPLLNTAIELQAIARVHRIGQQHETTVWMYLVDDTVEKSIYNLAVQRRLDHLERIQTKGATGTLQTRPLRQDNGEEKPKARLEEADTAELEQNPLAHLLTKGSGGGEVVPTADLWICLFSAAKSGLGGRRPVREGSADMFAIQDETRSSPDPNEATSATLAPGPYRLEDFR